MTTNHQLPSLLLASINPLAQFTMMTINVFKQICGLTSIDVKGGKGREFASTPIGTVFAMDGIDWTKEVFVIQNDGKMAGKEHLKGSYWFVNSNAKVTRTL